jgi:hypothetical protein
MSYQPDNTSGNQFKIYDWNVIDILDVKDDIKKICQINIKSGQKSGQSCQQKAHYYVTGIDGKIISICKTHSKSYDKQKLTRIYTVANISQYELARLAVNKLDKINFGISNEVIFESQPKKAAAMKNFSMMLFNYFIIRYIAEKPAHLQTLNDVKFVSSRNKLTVYDGPYIECKLKKQHSRNKFYAKEYCKYLLRGNQEKLQFFDKFKKKDDLADSFLQGVWYLMSNYSNPNKVKLQLIDNKNKTDNNIVKPKITLKPQLIGKDKLISIKENETTKKIKKDYNLNKYKNLKRGYKPRESDKKYTLSNIKYIVEKNQLTTNEKLQSFANHDPMLMPAIKSYFGDSNNFILSTT